MEMLTGDKYKFKCQICKQVLSSKQRAILHLDAKHPQRDKTAKNVARIVVAENVLKKENCKKKEPNKKIHPFSQQLSKVWENSNLFETFSLSSNATSKANPSVEVNVNNNKGEGESDKTSELSSYVSNRSDNGPSFSSSDLNNRHKNTFSVTKPQEKSNKFTPKIVPKFATPRSTKVGFQTPRQAVFRPLSPKPSLSASAEVKGPSYSPVKTREPLPVAVKKTRGHCGDYNCKGCNAAPCGKCLNCIHKSVRR